MRMLLPEFGENENVGKDVKFSRKKSEILALKFSRNFASFDLRENFVNLA